MRKLGGLLGDASITLGVVTADGNDGDERTDDAECADDADDADGETGGIDRGGAEVTWTMADAPAGDFGGADTDTDRGGSASRSSWSPEAVPYTVRRKRRRKQQRNSMSRGVSRVIYWGGNLEAEHFHRRRTDVACEHKRCTCFVLSSSEALSDAGHLLFTRNPYYAVHPSTCASSFLRRGP